jgi:hypothetical protein
MVFERPRGMHTNGIRELIVEVSSNSSQCDPRVGIEDVKHQKDDYGCQCRGQRRTDDDGPKSLPVRRLHLREMRLDLNHNIEPRDAIAASGAAVLKCSSTLGSGSGGSSSLLGGGIWSDSSGRRFRGCFGDCGHGLGLGFWLWLGLGLWEGWLPGRAISNGKATARWVVHQDRMDPFLQPAHPPQLGTLFTRRLASR